MFCYREVCVMYVVLLVNSKSNWGVWVDMFIIICAIGY